MEKLPTDKVVEIYEQKSRIYTEKPPEDHEMIVSRFEHKINGGFRFSTPTLHYLTYESIYV